MFKARLALLSAIAARVIARIFVGGPRELGPSPPPAHISGFSYVLHILMRLIDQSGTFLVLYVFVAYLAISMTTLDGHDDQLEYAKIEAMLRPIATSMPLFGEEASKLASDSVSGIEEFKKAHNEEDAELASSDVEDDLVLIDNDGETIENKLQTTQAPVVNVGKGDLSLHLPIMSFNIRHDSEEYNPANHFTQRLPRIKKLFERINPWIAGLQEGSNGQIVHILSELSPNYTSVIYRSRDGSVEDSGTSIFYDSSMVELQENETVWMSETPHVPFSKSWSTGSPRMLNMARFRLKSSAIQSLLKERSQSHASTPEISTFVKQLSDLDILIFNNHLDVWSEEARRAQSIFVGRRIAMRKRKFPQAFVVLTGDFNTAVGQRSYLHLTDEHYAKQHEYSIMKDAWLESPSKSHGVAHSFHGWQGTRLNNFIVRGLSAVAFTLYAMQMEMPRHIPHNWQEWKHALWNLLKVGPQFGVWESMPRFPYDRLHVDWVLYQEPQRPTNAGSSAPSKLDQDMTEQVNAGGNKGWLTIQPVHASLLDVRSENFSSDHYPLVVVFQIKRE